MNVKGLKLSLDEVQVHHDKSELLSLSLGNLTDNSKVSVDEDLKKDGTEILQQKHSFPGDLRPQVFCVKINHFGQLVASEIIHQ